MLVLVKRTKPKLDLIFGSMQELIGRGKKNEEHIALGKDQPVRQSSFNVPASQKFTPFLPYFWQARVKQTIVDYKGGWVNRRRTRGRCLGLRSAS